MTLLSEFTLRERVRISLFRYFPLYRRYILNKVLNARALRSSRPITLSQILNFHAPSPLVPVTGADFEAGLRKWGVAPELHKDGGRGMRRAGETIKVIDL